MLGLVQSSQSCSVYFLYLSLICVSICFACCSSSRSVGWLCLLKEKSSLTVLLWFHFFAFCAKMALFLVSGFFECVSSSVDLCVLFFVCVNFPLFSGFMLMEESSKRCLMASWMISCSCCSVSGCFILLLLFCFFFNSLQGH